MDHKTSVRVNGREVGSPERDVYRARPEPAGGLPHHLIELGELQVRLLRTDLKEAIQATKLGSILMVLSVAFLIAVIPLLLLSLTLGIEELFDLSRGVSLLITSGVATLVGIGLLWGGWNIVIKGTGKMARSRAEFKKNLRWLKQLASPGHPHRFGEETVS